MNNSLLQIKVKQRLNKLASNDYDNIECWQIAEAFNKVQLEWAGSTADFASINALVKQVPLKGTNRKDFFETVSLPQDYMRTERITAYTLKGDCTVKLKVHPSREADVDENLRDTNATPDLDWAETFGTYVGNNVRIYTAGKFAIQSADLVYYREPKSVLFAGCVDPGNGKLVTADQQCEFREHIIEMLIDRAVHLIAGDVEAVNQMIRTAPRE